MPRPARTRLPAVDDRLVMPESDAQILDGKLLIVPGADPPHATHHASLAYLLSAHTAPGHRAALDMLTRTSERSDFAPDASIYPATPDPETGGRRLESIAIEVVSEQRLTVPTKKARELSRRGVRRVIAIVLRRERVLEWDARTDRWRPMHQDESIEDPALAPPLPVRALLDIARADEAVLAALEARRPDLVARIEARGEARGEARAETEGRARELRGAVERLCAALSIPVGTARQRALERMDLEALRALLDTLAAEHRWPRPRA